MFVGIFLWNPVTSVHLCTAKIETYNSNLILFLRLAVAEDEKETQYHLPVDNMSPDLAT